MFNGAVAVAAGWHVGGDGEDACVDAGADVSGARTAALAEPGPVAPAGHAAALDATALSLPSS